MRNEIQLLNYYINSKDSSFLSKHNLNPNYFISTKDVVDWIEEYKSNNKGMLPTLATVADKFEDFSIVEDLDSVDYLINEIRNNKIYLEYRLMLTNNAKTLAEKNAVEAIDQMRLNIETLMKEHSSKIDCYDWVNDVDKRYEQYMEKHNSEGLAGITTGISKLDYYTGGWREDDLVLIAGRLGEGKSLISAFFAYYAWLDGIKQGINNPIVFISTEMPEIEVAYRLDTLRSHFSNRALNDGKLYDHEIYREYLEELKKKESSFLILTEDSNGGGAFTPSDIRAVIESEHPRLVVIDQLYDISDGVGETDIRKRIVNVSNSIRDVNLYTKTPILWVAQAGRESARDAKKDINASPEIYQIQESDTPAQKSTKVITLRLINNEIFKLSLKKNRGGERNKDVFLRANIDTGYYDEITEETAAF